MKFGQLVLRNIIKIVATRCQIVSLKCTKISTGAPPQTPLGELTALPRFSGWTKRVLLLREGDGCREGMEGREWGGNNEIGRELEEGGMGREERGKGREEGRRKKEKGRGDSPYKS